MCKDFKDEGLMVFKELKGRVQTVDRRGSKSEVSVTKGLTQAPTLQQGSPRAGSRIIL